jgi:hypothetical protein
MSPAVTYPVDLLEPESISEAQSVTAPPYRLAFGFTVAATV